MPATDRTSIEPAETAVILAVPELDHALETIASRRPDAVRAGIPAHVSVVYPFLPRARLDRSSLDRLQRHTLRFNPPDVIMSAPLQAEGILYSRPNPADAVDALRDSLEAEWPELAQERRAREQRRRGHDVGTHCTLALEADDDSAELSAILDGFLPQRIRLESLWLLVKHNDEWVQFCDLRQSPA